jgi:PAS domain S-box-containing protein
MPMGRIYLFLFDRMVFDNIPNALLAFIPGLLNLGILIYIILFLPRGKTIGIFTFFVIALMLWQIEDTITRVCATEENMIFWDRMLCIGWLGVAPLFFHFACSYAGISRLTGRLGLVCIYLPFCIFTMLYEANSMPLHFIHDATWGWINTQRPGTLDSFQRYYISITVVAAVFVLFTHAYRVRRNEEKKTQALVIALGSLIPTTQGIITQVVFPLILNIKEIPVTSSFLTFFSIGTIIALTRYRLFNISESIPVDTVLKNLTNIVLIISPNRRIIYINPHSAPMFELPAAEEDIVFLERIFPDQAIYEKFCGDVLDHSLEGKQVDNYETTFQLPGNKKIEALLSSELITSNKQVLGVMIVAIDITERLAVLRELKISNERYEYAMQATFDAIWDWHLSSNTVFWGKGFEDLFGHKLENKRTNIEFWSDHIHPADRERVMESIHKAIEGHEKKWTDEYRFLKANGEYSYVNDKGLVIRQNGRAVRMIGAMQDITELKKAETISLDLIARLQQKNKELQQFAYMVSHNLRAPIAKILGLATLINDPAEIDQSGNLLQYVSDEINNLDNVVKDMNRLITASDTGNIKTEFIEFEDELKLVMQVLENEIKESEATISFDFAEKGINSIKTYIYSILYNLVSNAIKYRKEGRPLHIMLSSYRLDQMICITVKDNGIGIDLQKYGDKIFGLYKRFNGNAVYGKGIGLYMLKTQVESLGGRVSVESKPGEGSVFTVNIPD